MVREDACSAPDHAPLEFRVLGSLQVVAGGEFVPLTGGRQRALLAALLVHANAVVSTDRIAELLWGGEQPREARKAIHTLVSRLRTLFEAAGGAPARDLIVTRPPGYILLAEPGQVDGARFEQLVRHASEFDVPGGSLDVLDEALGLWRGPALAEFEQEFARVEAGRLEELRLVAVEQRMDALLALGRHGECVPELETLVARHPFRERLRGQLMLALYRCARQPDALAAYRAFRELLAVELGLEPSPALQQLERDILQQRAELTPPSPPRRSSVDVHDPGLPAGALGNLPLEVTSFVGREEAVAAVVGALARARVVTLTGVGGVGKTRLALRAAREVAGQYADGAWLCELAPVGDPHAVASAVTTILRVPTPRGSTAEEALVEFLRSKRLLLVVDNCEHVVDAAGRVVDVVARSCPHVSLLVTSRQPLAVPGEQLWPVPPLDTAAAGSQPGGEGTTARQPPSNGHGPAAVELFCDRAVARQPDFAITSENASAVADICRGLDGLPLAIELAAARIGSLDPADIAARLGERFRLLTRAPRTVEPRHQTLRAVVDWSYGLLAGPERTLFDRLSVFAGSFTLAAAERTCADDTISEDDVADLVATLVDHSMVVGHRTASTMRYALLETLREYGQARLDERGELPLWQRRHAEYFVVLAEEAEPHICGAGEGRWVELLDRELDNLRAAHRWTVTTGEASLALRLSAALCRYAYDRLRDEVLAWSEAALELPGSRADPLYPAVCGVAAKRCANRGDLPRAAAYAERGLRAAADRDDPARLNCLHVLDDIALYEGRLGDDDLGREMARVARLSGDAYDESIAWLHQALGRAYLGDVEGALACIEQQRRLAIRIDNPSATAWHLYAEGETLLGDDPARAAVLLQQAVDLARSVGNRFVVGVALVSAASLQARHGAPGTALRSFGDVIEHWHQAGDWTHQWTTLRNLVTLFARVGADEPAAVLHAAVTAARTGARAFGPDAERLVAAERAAATKLDPQVFAAARARGRALSDEEAVVYARSEINRLLANVPG